MIYLTSQEASEFEGISVQAIRKRAASGKYRVREVEARGGNSGKVYEILLTSLSESAQERYWQKQAGDGPQAEAIKVAVDERCLNSETALAEKERREMAIHRACNCPDGVGKNEHMSVIAGDAGVSLRTLFRWVERYKESGTVEGVARRERADKGAMRSWSQDAIDEFCRRFMNNRRGSAMSIFADMSKDGFNGMGSLSGAYRILDGLNIRAKIFRDGGMRAIDNLLLPPILRDYSDLAPNDIWVGDQHTLDWFVMDKESGHVFRPQIYVWQDMATRGIVGMAMDRKYSSWTINLAMRDGVLNESGRRIFGLPKCVYTDWGKPETSKFLNGFQMRARHFKVRVENFGNEFLNKYGEQFGDEGLYGSLGIDSRKAIVRNSKAKPIERLYNTLEDILKDRNLPGWAGNYAGSLQDPDKDELKRLFSNCKMMSPADMFMHMIEAIEFYNSREHRGKGMMGMSPNDKFEMAMANGFKPVIVDRASANMVFLKAVRRKVEKRGVAVDNVWYHDYKNLIDLWGQWVEVRYDPFRAESVFIYKNGRFECEAKCYQYGSMINEELTGELIKQKRHLMHDVRDVVNDLRGNAEAPEDKVKRAALRFDDGAKEAEKTKKINRKVLSVDDIFRIRHEQELVEREIPIN